LLTKDLKMTIIIYNPRCSKCRQTKEFLKENFETRLYLENPLTENEIKIILKKLGIEAKGLLRTKEKKYQELVEKFGEPTNELALKWMVENPILIERPIVIKGDKAVIARPPEKVFEIL